MKHTYSDEAATFGDRLAAARLSSRMSSAQVAARLGVKQETVEQWEADQSEPRPNRMQLLAGVLNVSLLWLMTGEGDDFLSGADDEVIPEDRLLEDLRELAAQNLMLGRRLVKLERQLSLHLRKGRDGVDDGSGDAEWKSDLVDG